VALVEGFSNLALKRWGNKRSGSSLSRNEFNGNVKEIEHFC